MRILAFIMMGLFLHTAHAADAGPTPFEVLTQHFAQAQPLPISELPSPDAPGRRFFLLSKSINASTLEWMIRGSQTLELVPIEIRHVTPARPYQGPLYPATPESVRIERIHGLSYEFEAPSDSTFIATFSTVGSETLMAVNKRRPVTATSFYIVRRDGDLLMAKAARRDGNFSSESSFLYGWVQ